MEIKEQKIQIDGLNINFKSIGEGKPFLILHGWRSSSDKWIKTAEMLSAKGYKVIIPDLPGFGKSDLPKNPWDLDKYADFAKKFAATLNLGKLLLGGHSFSGGTCIKYAIKYQNDIEKMFLFAPACIRRDSFKKKFFRIFSKLFKVFSLIPGVRKAFYKFIVRKSDYQHADGVMKETYMNVIKDDLSKILSSVKCKTIIIWGGKDSIVPISQGEEIQSKIYGSKLVVIPGANHSLEISAPENLSSEILKNIL